MKKNLYTLSFAFLGVLSANISFAQGQDGLKYCGTTEIYNKVISEHPELLINQQELEKFTQQYTEDNQRSSSQIYIIPIVFHIIHNYGPENISDDQIYDQMRILNEDFRKLNADTASIVSQFQSIADDMEIEFRLAQIDPNGNCTNGIDRIVSMETYIGDDGSKLNPWPRSKYLNVWVVNTISSGAAGYAYLPGTAPNGNVDGIMIRHDYIGSMGTANQVVSRALTHEIGHFLNLQHVWGSTNQPGVSCGNDGVSDTPVTKGWTSCNLSGAVCNSSIVENVQNFMEYSYCSRMFSAGQGTRMRAALNSSTGQRSSLWTSTNLTATGVLTVPPTLCAPKADFKSNYKSVCAGESILFTDLSWNGSPTSWSWSFPGGTPSTSTDSMPVITYNTPGTYQVALTSTNSAGSDTETKIDYITVSSTTAAYSSWQYYEGFESGPIPNNDWTIKSGSGQSWQQTTTAYYNGLASMKLANASSASGDADEAISPSLDFTAVPSPYLKFRVAHALKSSSNTDKLRVLVSINCGKSWTQRYVKSGSTLATVSPQSTAFTPTSPSQWRLDSVNIGTYANYNNVRIKFEFTGGGGNNIYIDDINLYSLTGIDEADAGNTDLGIYPNPAGEDATVSFTLAAKQAVTIKVLDVIGREAGNVYKGELPAGDHRLPLSIAGLRAGMYFVKMEVNGKVLTQKLIVE